ncbi:hypothetical protein G4B88_015760, partial [Cannabis sativa]
MMSLCVSLFGLNSSGNYSRNILTFKCRKNGYIYLSENYQTVSVMRLGVVGGSTYKTIVSLTQFHQTRFLTISTQKESMADDSLKKAAKQLQSKPPVVAGKDGGEPPATGSEKPPPPPPPEKPLPGDCCGSGCVRCVWDIYYDELEDYNKLYKTDSKPSYKKGAYIFGSVDLCDFVLEHPTVSRFHAEQKEEPVDVNSMDDDLISLLNNFSTSMPEKSSVTSSFTRGVDEDDVVLEQDSSSVPVRNT